MATQDEASLPTSKNSKRSTADLLPRFYKTDSNKKFLAATLDQLTAPGTVKKLTGYIGRQNAKAVKATDVFISATDSDRQNYQLEPAAVIQDYLGNTSFYKDYIDHVNHIEVAGGITNNHSRMNQQEFYSWNPHIDWDKFVNFQQYYWLPYGPAAIEVQGQQRDIESTYTVSVEDQGDNYVYLFSPDGLTRNPTLTLYRGQTYNFSISSPNSPFSIKTVRVAGDLERYTAGVSAFAVEQGTITFTVPLNSPDVLFYVSESDANTGGVFEVKDIDENAFLDLNADILGKKTYTLSNGISLTNGMKVSFVGQVVPAEYTNSKWYVEGVGTAIKLVSEQDLEIISSYSQERALLFDDEPFDLSPFSTLTSFPRDKDYILINRASADRNQWSRYNRWFHQDVIISTAAALGTIPELDQESRATRPIIEFEAGLKLFNFGHKSKKNVDVIDTFTTDVFSTIEGSLGYNIDGINLADGMRVLFTADTDRFVSNKIFKVNFITVTDPGRQVEFSASTGVNVSDNTITFPTSHGLTVGSQVTYLNNGNVSISGLTNRRVYFVSVINDTQIRLFNDRLLTIRANLFSTGSGQHKIELFSGISRQINLIEDVDATPLENETVLVKTGTINQGTMFWFDGIKWQTGQRKLTTNQPPKFDVFDSNGNSYGDISAYDGSNFTGCSVFSYKVGLGNADTSLAFPLSYRNINNVGDIIFEFTLLSDNFSYKQAANVISKNTDIGYLKVVNNLTTVSYQNGWTRSDIINAQPVIRIFKESGLLNNFPIDVYDFKDNLDDLQVKLYINGIRQNRKSFSIVDGPIRKSIVLSNDVTTDDVVTLKCYTKQAKNNNGYYEIPLSLQNNPLNENVKEFTLGQVIDHVDSIVENLEQFDGAFPGFSNLRNIGNITPYGTRFVQHSAPLNFSLYHFGSKTANVSNALKQAYRDYGKFKKAFITFATESGIDTEPRLHVDYILQEMSKDRPKTQPYYLSDMFPYSGGIRNEYTVLDARIKTYPLTTAFNLNSLSNHAVNIYLNGNQLLHGRDYVFGTDIFFEILTSLAEDDIIEVFEFQTTDGCFCPPTPTKLGLYPIFEPAIYIDDTYLEPTRVIQGHDGSITVAFNDYRDALILELEMRIFNNIKVKYDTSIFDINSFIPGYKKETTFSKEEFESVLSQFFFEWTTNVPQDYTAQDNKLWDRLNPFTWNFRTNSTPDDAATPSFWRGIYRWTLGTDRPHTHPWECLGFSIKPSWWNTVYGPAPYTSNNYILWNDIRYGNVREPGVPLRTYSALAKDIISAGVPVTDSGTLQDPYNAGYVNGIINPTSQGFYVFGDIGPVESAWRRSSYYPFALIHTALLLQPNHVLATCLDRSRITRNLNNQLVFKDTELRIKLADLKLPSTALSSNRVFASGLINYIVDYITSDVTLLITQYANDLVSLTNKLGSKIGGFTNKPKFRLLLDSKSVSSSGGVFVPEENYQIIFNVSSPIQKISYSGVVITKYVDGYEIRGYNVDNPYFTYYPYNLRGSTINVGGISESYTIWTDDKYYVAGQLVRANNQFYRVKLAHRSGETFDLQYFTRLAELPMTGGRDAEFRKGWDSSVELTISYGTKLNTIQDIVDFLQGYSAYLENQGFVFDEFNTDLKTVDNWDSSIKEFLFWTTQNWADGAVISLSPAANKLVLKSTSSVVSSVIDDFFEYKVFKVDGQKLDLRFVNTFRDGNTFTMTSVNTNNGIYGATLYLVQKEHVILLDNTTLFNDVIYDQAPGYKQERIKVIGYISTNWNGGFNIPGFVYDNAVLQEWQPWTDFNVGDVVKYKEFYYASLEFTPGTELFVSNDWVRLDDKPEPALLPNWEYKTLQFSDFYSLDSDNFDTGQQKMAQHLIGYQKRQYLENIIQDDVSQYKFYQGMIIEKGTTNVFNKLFDVLSADDTESLTFNEEWAVRVGNYGAVASYNEIEFVLDESKFKLNPQPVELTSTIDPNVVDFVYRQLPTDIYVKPVGYSNNIWSTNDTISYLRTPGYVRYEDTRVSIDSLTDIITTDISSFVEGDYVWAAFEGREWNIYRFTTAEFKVEAVTYSNKVLVINTNVLPDIQAGDIIGIENADYIKGFYVVTAVTARQIFISTTIAGWQDPFADLDNILIYQFISARTSNVDNINDIIPSTLKLEEKIWADDNGEGLYSVYVNSPVFTKKPLAAFAPASNLALGSAVAVSPNGQLAVIGTDNNTVYIYSKHPTASAWIASSQIIPSSTLASTSGLNFGKELAVSVDGSLIAISADTASDVNGSSLTEQGYVGIYYKAASTNFELLELLTSPAPANNERFGSKVAFSKQGAAHIIAVSATGYNSGQGRVYFYKYENNIWSPYATPLSTASAGDGFGYNIAFSNNGTIFVVAAPSANNETGEVYVYTLINDQYILLKTLSVSADAMDGDLFGKALAVSADGNYIAVGKPLSDTLNLNAGKVCVFSGLNFDLHQIIFSPKKENNEKFGLSVSFMDDSLIIFSANGDIETITTFNEGGLTTFDNNSLRIVDKIIDAGRIDIYDRYNTKFIYGESLTADLDSFNDDMYGHAIASASNNILVGAPNKQVEFAGQGTVYAYARPSGSSSWSVSYKETARPNAYKIKKAFLYNRTQNELISYVDVVDALQGKIPGPADQEISYKTYFDPATYSIGSSLVNVDDGMNWTKAQVGMLWWDLTRARFLDNQIGGVVYRSTTWNRLYKTASIDIYEWTETRYLPSEWDKLSGTDKGSALGITGTSKYGDSAYSIKKKYDSVSQTFQNTYYYWVKNPSVAPNVIGRSLSAFNVSKLISDPVAENYTCLALTGTDSFNLVNTTNLIVGNKCNLTVQYWIVDNEYTETNAHSQWKIISEHPNTIIPVELEKKWIHSLIGKDDNNRVVPNIKLPFKQRYGVNFRPRQGMFINRVEALKQFIERVNSILSTRLIVDDYDLSDLEQASPQPTKTSGIWDEAIDTNSELRFVRTATVEQAILTPVIVDGRITNVNIINPGRGYVNAPYVVLSTTGKDAQLKTIINDLGQVTGVTILKTGEGYSDETTCIVRPFTVLVKSDTNTFDKWSTYAWNSESLSWDRVQGQSYDVTNYWNYIDWYATGYNQFTKIDHIVDNTYQLATLESNVGDIVKVLNVGTGGWLLLEKFNNITTIDYTQNYSVIGRNNGTIKFSNSLYEYGAVGYDSVLFDSLIYDNLAETEVSIIINTIKNKILVDDLRIEYLKLFFASLRYVLQEQTFVDWAIKTSFVKATHNVGNLKQKVNYNSDNLPSFEEYVKEVKPYRTQIREYVSSYTSIDRSQSSVTDFDLLSVIDSRFKVTPLTVNITTSGEIDSVFPELLTYPWKHWYDHVGFTVQSIDLIDGGSGYIDNPIVKIEGGFGSGATAKAYVANGKVNRLVLLTGGKGYLKAPIITIEGGLSIGGTAARAAVVIESEVVRSNKISIKFDRITRAYYVTEVYATESGLTDPLFVGTGSRLQFPLKFSPESKVDPLVSVTVDGVDVLRGQYSLTTKKSTNRGYTSYSGLLTLDSAPTTGAIIEVTYKKNFNHLSAADRINFYYTPGNGQYGKDLAQLMTGIDYGGVSVTGIGFNISGGWDSLPWFTDTWDGFDSEFNDFIVTAGVSNSFILPYTPALEENINVYVNSVRIDGIDNLMPTFVGDGVNKTVTIPSGAFTSGDTIVFRKETSDGSFTPLPGEYDTQLSGGNLAYSSATGIEPDDIILDGDGFVTPMSSTAPEEIVPGQVTDALAIKVYQLPTSGSAKITFKNYIADGTSTVFNIGQVSINISAIIVKVDNVILKNIIDYTFNASTVTFLTAPANKSVVSIITFGAASSNLLDTNYFVADGSTREYITDASFIDNMGSFVFVDGVVVPYELFRTTDSYDSPGKVGIRFGTIYPVGSLIAYMITGDNNQTASIIKSEEILGNNVDDTFTLSNALGNSKPYSNNILVIKDGGILRPTTTEYFTLADNELEYTLSSFKSQPYIANPADYRVYLNGDELFAGSQYVFDVSVMSVVVKPAAYIEGARLAVVSFVGAEYIVEDQSITFTTVPSSSSKINVISFYNHDVKEILRTAEFTSLSSSLINGSYDYFTYTNLVGGRFKLNRTVMLDDYVWVIKNNVMLSHSSDYYVDSDLTTIKLKTPLVTSDVLDVVCFSDNIVNHSYGYMQFKDMLNRTHYKRISKAKSTRLARDLLQKDAEIYLIDGSTLSAPSAEDIMRKMPGVIEINGERIEYFKKEGNVLSQLRRATLGTGAPSLHRARTIVLDIGPTETIPYTDRTVVSTIISDGISNVVPLDYIPDTKDSIEVFVGGIRMKKNAYSLFEEDNGFPYSPEGDRTYGSEFSVDGVTSQVTIGNDIDLQNNERIVVVKKIGKLWNPEGTDLTYQNNDIANFIKNTEAIFSQYLVDKYQYVLKADQGNTLTDDNDEPLELD
jgi:hypothetical protein